MDYETINMIGDMVAGLRLDAERDLSVTITAHDHSADCPSGYFGVTIAGQTSHAKNLGDALALCRAKVERAKQKVAE